MVRKDWQGPVHHVKPLGPSIPIFTLPVSLYITTGLFAHGASTDRAWMNEPRFPVDEMRGCFLPPLYQMNQTQ